MKRWDLVFACLCLLTAGGTCEAAAGDKEDTTAANRVVVRVGDATVTAEEFSDRLNFIPHPGQYRSADTLKRALAASIVAEKILSDEAHRIHLDTLQDARKVIGQAEKEAVYERWMDNEVVGKISVSEKALLDAFQRFRQQRVVDYVTFSDSASAVSARRTLQQGKSLDQAATAGKGGSVEKKTLEYAEALPLVEDAVFSLHPGEISRVVKVDRKYYLFKLVSVRPHPTYSNGSFSYWRPALEKRVRSRLVDRQFEKVLPAVLQGKEFQVNRRSYEYVVGQIAQRLPFHNEDLLRSPELVNQEFVQIPESIETRLAEPFMHFSDGTVWTIGDVWNELRFGPYLLNYRSEAEFKADFRDLLRRMVIFESIVERGYGEGLQNSAYVKRETRMWRDDLLSRLYQGVVEDTVQVADAELASWYDSHPRDFLRPEMRKIQEIVVPDRTLAASLLDSVSNGADMAELTRRHPAPGGRTPDSTGVHWIVKGSRGDVGHTAFQLKPGGLYGPIDLDSAHFAIIQLLEVQAETPRAFAEVKDQIRLELKRKKTYEALNELLDKRVPEYPVTIHQDVLAGIDVLEGNLMVRKSHFPNRFAVPLSTPFDPDTSWFRKILDAQSR